MKILICTSLIVVCLSGCGIMSKTKIDPAHVSVKRDIDTSYGGVSNEKEIEITIYPPGYQEPVTQSAKGKK